MTSKINVQDTDLQITKEDQAGINRFSQLNQQLKEHDKNLAAKKDLLNQYDDALGELEIMDDDEQVRFKFGDCFFNVNAEEAMTHTEKHIKQEKAEAAEIEDKYAEIETELKKLKARLYAKFGKSINLEED